MPFTYVTYNPDSRDNNLCDKRILTITNLETLKKKMFHTILLELFLLFRPFKKTANIHGLRFLHRSYLNTCELNKMAGCSYEKNRRGS